MRSGGWGVKGAKRPRRFHRGSFRQGGASSKGRIGYMADSTPVVNGALDGRGLAGYGRACDAAAWERTRVGGIGLSLKNPSLESFVSIAEAR